MTAAGKGLAIVTGAGGGIGQALCRALLAAGIDVLAVGRRPPALIASAALPDGAGAMTALAADITDPEARKRIVQRAQQLGSPPRWLIHAAALGGLGLFADGDDEASARLLETNVLAPIALTRALLPVLQRQPDAAVVAIGSTFGSIGFPGYAEYSASKFALRGLFEALAREHADQSIRFQWLAPRATRTGFNSAAADALNRELKTAVDAPEWVAAELLRAILRRDRRRQLGWPEKFFVRLNGLWPALVDRALSAQLSVVRRHAGAVARPVLEEIRS